SPLLRPAVTTDQWPLGVKLALLAQLADGAALGYQADMVLMDGNSRRNGLWDCHLARDAHCGAAGHPLPETAQIAFPQQTVEASRSDNPKPRRIRLERRSPSSWRATFDPPPLNIFGPETIPQLNEIITALETDEQVKVIVFDSAVEGFFLIHYDFLARLEDT